MVCNYISLDMILFSLSLLFGNCFVAFVVEVD